MTIGESIKATRKKFNFTQMEVAKKAGISVNSLRLYEAGKREPNFTQMLNIAEALDVTLVDLIPGWPKEHKEIFDVGWQSGYEDRTEEMREATNFGCDELDKRREDEQYLRMLLAYENLNRDGQQRVVEYAEALEATKKYAPKTPPEPILTLGKDGWVTQVKRPPEGHYSSSDGKE